MEYKLEQLKKTSFNRSLNDSLARSLNESDLKKMSNTEDAFDLLIKRLMPRKLNKD